MLVSKMAACSHFKQTAHVVRWLVLLLIACTPGNGQVVFATQPTNQVRLEGGTVIFSCAVVVNGSTSQSTTLRWYKDAGEITNRTGKFEIVGNSVSQSLSITDTTVEDTGYYYCTYNGMESQKGKLEILPSSWKPDCERSPSSGAVAVGDSFNITCSSTGHTNTSLRWLIPDGSKGSTLDDTQVQRLSLTKIVVSHTGTVTEPVSPLLFVCEAILDGLSSESCSISINDEMAVDVIPYVVVGLMSLIALLLFFVVLIILFRHRQCRFCQEPMLEPHAVLHADSLQTGSWIPPPVVAIDVDVSEDGGSVKDVSQTPPDADSAIQPPDVVPALENVYVTASQTDQPQETEEPEISLKSTPKVTVAPDTKTVKPKSKTKNLTINKNMDQGIDKPAEKLEKNPVPLLASKTHPSKKGEKKVVKHYKEPPVKARMKSPKDPIYAQIKKLNVPSKSAPSGAADTPSTSSGAETNPPQPPELPPRPPSTAEEMDSKETSSIATGDTTSTDQSQLVNDLGRGDSKKKRVRHYRKKSEDKRNSNPEEGTLNIQANKEESSESQRESSTKENVQKTPADRIIYAELDFSKDVGLNIKE